MDFVKGETYPILFQRRNASDRNEDLPSGSTLILRILDEDNTTYIVDDQAFTKVSGDTESAGLYGTTYAVASGETASIVSVLAIESTGSTEHTTTILGAAHIVDSLRQMEDVESGIPIYGKATVSDTATAEVRVRAFNTDTIKKALRETESSSTLSTFPADNTRQYNWVLHVPGPGTYIFEFFKAGIITREITAIVSSSVSSAHIDGLAYTGFS